MVYIIRYGRYGENGSFRKNKTFCESRTIFFMAFRNFRPFPPLPPPMSLGGLRVTNPTIRLACPSVCPSVCLSVCPSVRQHFACKHDNSTNIRRIDPKLIPWMYLRSVLVKFKDGWPLTYFWGHGGQFKHENLQFSLVNTITQQILIALGPNLYHGCISRVSWLSSNMDDLDLFLRSQGSI